MNICFRVDASYKIGTGHVMRCLTLAEELKKKGNNVVFVCRLHDGHLCKRIIQLGFEVLKLEKPKEYNEGRLYHSKWLGVSQLQDVKETKELIITKNFSFDWIIVDHYAIDEEWETEIRSLIPNIMIIDDLADRKHDCDILLDQNYYIEGPLRYKQLVPTNCQLLIGPKYALLRNEFIKFHNLPIIFGQEWFNILVFYGGSDPTNETLKMINVIKQLGISNLSAHIVVGPSNPNAKIIKEACNDDRFIFHYNINYMAKLMYETDIALCAGGSTTWERYCVGLPGIVTAVAQNQIELCENLQFLGIDKYTGVSEFVNKQVIQKELKSFLLDKSYLKRKELAKSIVDGKGKLRVIKKIM